MNKTIPTLPCSNIDLLVEFYKHLGFELVGQFTRSYIILSYDDIELHFYGTKQVTPEINSSMCIIQTDSLDQLYCTFSSGLKTNTGKIPRSGFPKISKIRDLSEDRRFTLTDPSGNTFYILTPKQVGSDNFFRDLDNEQYAETFTVLYDLVYSKEDCKVANNLLPKLLSVKGLLDDLDRAKLLLIAFDIQFSLKTKCDDIDELNHLIMKNKGHENWKKIEIRFNEIISC